MPLLYFFLTETQITQSTPDLAAPNNYRLVSSFAKKHGVCAYINPNISYARAVKYEINNKHFNSLVLRFPVDNTFMFIFAIYRSPNTPCSIDSFEELGDIICSLFEDNPGAQLTVLGDFNIHNVKWLKHSSHTDPAGRSAELFASTFGLQQLVDKPTRIPRDGQFPNTLDLVLSSSASQNSVSVDPPLGSSDHCVVTINISFTLDPISPPPPRSVYQYSKANWAELEIFYKVYPWRLATTCTDVNNAVNSFTDGIKLGMKLFIPLVHLKKNRKEIYSPKARRALKVKHNAYQAYNRIRSKVEKENLLTDPFLKVTRDDLRRVSNNCKATVNSEDFQFYKKKTDKVLDHPNNPRFYFHTVRSLQSNFVKPTTPPFNNNGVILSDPVEKCNLLASLFAANSTISLPNFLPHTLPRNQHTMNPVIFRKKIILKYLLELNQYKTTGPDGIPALILKKFASIFAPILSKIFVIALRSAHFPDAWKSVNIQPIPKKGDKADASNYRPIAIISVLSKVFEKYLNWHILNYIENTNILNDCQYGFRTGRSTCDALTMLTHRWNKILEQKGEAYVISLDIAKAFDAVWHSNLISKLQSYGFNVALTSLLGDFLSKRKISVVLDGYMSDQFELNAGVPQGSPLASTLFLIYINDLLSIAENSLHSYADDTTLHGNLFTNNLETTSQINDKRQNLAESLSADLNLIESWSEKNLMNFNSAKTQLCVISRRKTEVIPPIIMNHQSLNTAKSLHLLGVSLSESLIWNEHIENIAKGAAQKLGLLARCRKFFNADQTMRVYKSMIRPCLEYCSPVWGGASQNALKILDSVQRRAVRIIKDPNISGSLHSLQHRRDVADLTLFYRYYYGMCSDELKMMVPPPKTFKRVSRGSTNSHPHTVEVVTCRTTHFQNDFFTRAAYKWNSLPANLFLPPSLDAFKSGVHKYLLDHPLPRFSIYQH